MSVTSTPIYPQSVNNAALAVVNATSTTITTFITAGSNAGSKIEWINAATSDTAVNNVTFYLYNGTTSYPIGVIQIPAGSGNTYNVPPISVLNYVNLSTSTQNFPQFTFDGNGNKFLYLASGWSLQVSVLAAVTSGKQLTLTAQVENF